MSRVSKRVNFRFDLSYTGLTARGDSDHIPPLLPGTVTVALVPSRGQTAFHRPAPSGSGPVTSHPVTSRSARADSEYRWPTWLMPTRIRSPITSLLGSGHSDTGRIHGSGRLGSQRPVTSHDADHSNTAGTGMHPARARARTSGASPIVQKSQAEDPAGNRRSSSRPLRQGLRWSTPQALRSAGPGAQLHRA
jgi:hypothetical protein